VAVPQVHQDDRTRKEGDRYERGEKQESPMHVLFSH
jgi:hypothetical protein